MQIDISQSCGLFFYWGGFRSYGHLLRTDPTDSGGSSMEMGIGWWLVELKLELGSNFILAVDLQPLLRGYCLWSNHDGGLEASSCGKHILLKNGGAIKWHKHIASSPIIISGETMPFSLQNLDSVMIVYIWSLGHMDGFETKLQFQYLYEHVARLFFLSHPYVVPPRRHKPSNPKPKLLPAVPPRRPSSRPPPPASRWRCTNQQPSSWAARPTRAGASWWGGPGIPGRFFVRWLGFKKNSLAVIELLVELICF